jgi:hypothetical protein
MYSCVQVEIRTKEGIAWTPGSPSRLPSNGREKFSGHLVGVNTRYGITSAGVVISNHVCMPVPVVSDEISNPIWMAWFTDGLSGESHAQWARAGRDRRLRAVTHVTIRIATTRRC